VPSRRSVAPGSAADEVLALGRAGLIEIYISPAILDEIDGVLSRKFRWSATRVREARAAIGHFTVLVHPQESAPLPPEPTLSSPVTTTC